MNMSSSHKKLSIITLIILLPLIILARASGWLGIPSLFIHVKTAMSLGFVLLAVYSAYKNKSLDRLSLFCVFGVTLGMLGDIFLELNGKLENIGVLSGLLMFLIQHIIWCTGMLIHGRSSGKKKRLLITMPLSALGVSLFVIGLTHFVNATLGDMTVPVFIYGIILTWAYTIPLTIREKGDKRLLMLAIAGILFFISDSLLVQGLFGGGSSPVISTLNLIAYYYAQYIIALSTGVKGEKSKENA